VEYCSVSVEECIIQLGNRELFSCMLVAKARDLAEQRLRAVRRVACMTSSLLACVEDFSPECAKWQHVDCNLAGTMCEVDIFLLSCIGAPVRRRPLSVLCRCIRLLRSYVVVVLLLVHSKSMIVSMTAVSMYMCKCESEFSCRVVLSGSTCNVE